MKLFTTQRKVFVDTRLHWPGCFVRHKDGKSNERGSEQTLGFGRLSSGCHVDLFSPVFHFTASTPTGTTIVATAGASLPLRSAPPTAAPGCLTTRARPAGSRGRPRDC